MDAKSKEKHQPAQAGKVKKDEIYFETRKSRPWRFPLGKK